jgi:hypothetical protein
MIDEELIRTIQLDKIYKRQHVFSFQFKQLLTDGAKGL